jgi:hypothetical protein
LEEGICSAEKIQSETNRFSGRQGSGVRDQVNKNGDAIVNGQMEIKLAQFYYGRWWKKFNCINGLFWYQYMVFFLHGGV